ASATALPFRDGAFDAALAVLTVHHWPDRARGLAELRRVARDRVVILTWIPDAASFWLVDDYFPALAVADRALFDSLEALGRLLGPLDVRAVPIPHDCVDGFLGAYWRRPEAYLDAAVRGAMSTFTRIDTERGVARLRSDLADGTWRRRHGALIERDALDLGYRMVIARGAGAA
ncbi:MAG TPA: methyltransferase domain-containing protein, partial [Methylomirabilota bacterium]|nr:methyltransferase domain-containing protein [Methylomirabilota bacterium]